MSAGPEEYAEHREHFDNLPADPDDMYEDLLDIAAARMIAWAIDKVLEST